MQYLARLSDPRALAHSIFLDCLSSSYHQKGWTLLCIPPMVSAHGLLTWRGYRVSPSCTISIGPRCICRHRTQLGPVGAVQATAELTNQPGTKCETGKKGKACSPSALPLYGLRTSLTLKRA